MVLFHGRGAGSVAEDDVCGCGPLFGELLLCFVKAGDGSERLIFTGEEVCVHQASDRATMAEKDKELVKANADALRKSGAVVDGTEVQGYAEARTHACCNADKAKVSDA